MENKENSQEINLIEKKETAKQIYSFIFEKPQNFNWKTGQHALFKFKEQDNDYRIFTISSSQNENKIIFTTLINENPSNFKKKLMNLEPKNKILIKGPYGEFILTQQTKKIIGIAGGIGITPFRAITYDLATKKDLKEIKLELIFSAKENNYAFKQELEEYKIKNPNIKIYYKNNRHETQQHLIELINQHKNNVHYFISGKPNMVESIKELLKEHQISSSNIKTDPFEGY